MSIRRDNFGMTTIDSDVIGADKFGDGTYWCQKNLLLIELNLNKKIKITTI